MARIVRRRLGEAVQGSLLPVLSKRGAQPDSGRKRPENLLKWGPLGRRIAEAVGICGKKWGKVVTRCGQLPADQAEVGQ